MRLGLTALCLLTALLQAGCSSTPYYLQSVTGHLAMMHAAQPIDQWLADPQTPPTLKTRLALAQRIRRFAATDLGLPDNASYQRYADLHRSSVVWNVVAAPPFSLTLKTWCFPVAGCVGYRGYFDEAQAKALAATLQAQGLEASVYGVPAYSTLGWMNWAGGDPLLSTFIYYPEGELARMVFHELAHQVLYVKDDTPFNESYATAVERLGGAAWLAQHASPEARAQYARFDERRNAFRALVRETRQALAAIYEPNDPLAFEKPAQAAMKLRAMEHFRTQYAALAAAWDADEAALATRLGPAAPPALPHTGYDRWVANANNAAFGAFAAYDAWVPAFEALFARHTLAGAAAASSASSANTADQPPGATPSAWPHFFDAVRQLAALPQPERTQALRQLMPVGSTTSPQP
jgi:predicted aminopeptidase